MQCMNLLFLDITKYKFCTENFKMAPFSKLLPKGHAILISQSIWSCNTSNVCFLTFTKSNFCIENAQIFFSIKVAKSNVGVKLL